MSDRSSKEALAAETWRRLFGFLVSTHKQRSHVLEQQSLTPNDARALGSLDAEGGRTMRSLAEEWGCDASNATWMVDRLERRGFAERRMQPSDRRVKLVVLTPAGSRAKEDLISGMSEPPPVLMDLDIADLETLSAVLAKLPIDESVKWSNQRRGD